MPVIRLIHCKGCGHPVDPNARCTTCGHTHGQATNRSRRYSSKQWRDLRAEAIKLHPYCAKCGTPHDLTGDHLRYPASSIADIIVLCCSCHGRSSQAKQL